jgi:hypothetical protein
MQIYLAYLPSGLLIVNEHMEFPLRIFPLRIPHAIVFQTCQTAGKDVKGNGLIAYFCPFSFFQEKTLR